jgi:uncharacterized protein (DUF433 family)
MYADDEDEFSGIDVGALIAEAMREDDENDPLLESYLCGRRSTAMTIEPRPVPLTRTAEGVLRVTGTRIPLERIIECYKEGETPETIVDAFDSLRLADVYAIISYYLDHKEEVEEYIRKQEEEAEAIRRMIEASQPPRPNLRQELLARWARMEKGNDAPAGQ